MADLLVWAHQARADPVSKSNININYIYQDTPVRGGKINGGKHFVAISPYPAGVKSRAAWIGICPTDEVTARALANLFTTIAESYEAKGKQK